MAIVLNSCFILLLVSSHAAAAFFNIKSISEKVEVSPGETVSIACPGKALNDDDMVTWETTAGEFLGLGNEFLVQNVDRPMELVCRRRSIRSGVMISARVQVQLGQRLQSNGHSTRAPWRELPALELKIASGALISASCLPLSDPPRDVKIRWEAPDGSVLGGGNLLRKRARRRTDFGDYVCEAVAESGTRWRRTIRVREEAARRSANVLQNDINWPWSKKKTTAPLLTTTSSSTIKRTTFPTPKSSTTRRPVTTRKPKRIVKRMRKVELVLDDRAIHRIACPDPGPIGKRPGFSQFQVRWIRGRQIVSESEELVLQYSSRMFGEYECERVYRNREGDTRKIQITVILNKMPTSEYEPAVTRRHAPVSKKPKHIVKRMRKVELVLDNRAEHRIACPDPGHVGRFPGFSQSHVRWIRGGEIVSENQELVLQYSSRIFGAYECQIVYRNWEGDIRRIIIPVILNKMPTYVTEPPLAATTVKQRALPQLGATAAVSRIYELSPKTIKVLKNETVMLICPNDASIATTAPLTSFRQIWRDQRGVIGNEKIIFLSTGTNKRTEVKYSCQHDFLDQEGRIVSLLKNYTLRLASNQIEVPVGERQDIFVLRSTKIRLLCVSNEKDGDNYEWIHPSGQPVSSSNLLERLVISDLDFGEYKCTVWRADGTSQLLTVRVNEKLPTKAKTVTRRRYDWLQLRCIHSPPTEATFEWVHPKRTVVSRNNVLRWQLNETADFGHYVCYASTPLSPLPPSDFMVLEYPVSPYVTPRAPATALPVKVVDGSESIARVRLGDSITMQCWNSPYPDATYEWVHPNSFIVAWTNILRRNLKKESDFGHYVCHAYVQSVHVHSRHVVVLKSGSAGGVYTEPKKGTVYLRRNSVTYFTCVENPQGEVIYEWVNPQGFVVSQKNVLRRKLSKDSDFGHYVCRAISSLGRMYDRDVFIEEDKTERLIHGAEKIFVAELETVNITCVENPPPRTSFEWIDEKGMQRSTSNILTLTVAGRSDIGKFVCNAISPDGPLQSREVIIVIRPIGLLIAPENGILKACRGQASASAMCWMENYQRAPLWRSVRRNNSRVETSVLSGRRARLALLNVDFSDHGRIFECYVRSPELRRQLTVIVEGECKTCFCLPTEKRCLPVDGRQPRKRCISVHWMCDGEDDCGNGFDERDCPYREMNSGKNQCEGQTMRCPNSFKVIPRGFWCDGEPDCDRGEDEVACQSPQIRFPYRLRRKEVRLGATTFMQCIAFGTPPPKLIWRFNWDCLPSGFRSTCSCDKEGYSYTTRCTLFTPKISRDLLGLYTCEALSGRGRAFAEDYHLVPLQ